MIASVRRKWLVASWLVLLLLPVFGCGKSGGVPRLPVYGTVTQSSGETIDGTVTFVPDQQQPGPGAVASLVKGDYRFDKTNGPTAGPHRVVVTKMVSKELSPTKSSGPKPRPGARKAASKVGSPTEWTFSATIPQEGPYKFDFQLP